MRTSTEWRRRNAGAWPPRSPPLRRSSRAVVPRRQDALDRAQHGRIVGPPPGRAPSGGFTRRPRGRRTVRRLRPGMRPLRSRGPRSPATGSTTVTVVPRPRAGCPRTSRRRSPTGSNDRSPGPAPTLLLGGCRTGSWIRLSSSGVMPAPVRRCALPRVLETARLHLETAAGRIASRALVKRLRNTSRDAEARRDLRQPRPGAHLEDDARPA